MITLSLIVNALNDQLDTKESRKLLDQYLKGAVKEIGYTTRSEADRNAETFAEKFVKNGEHEGISDVTLSRKKKEVKSDLKEFGLKERFNYFANIKAHDENPVMPFMAAIASTVAVGATAISCAADGEIGKAVAVMGIGAAAATGAALAYHAGAPKNEEQAKKITEYTDLKHAQLALKKLEAAIKNEKKEIEARYKAAEAQKKAAEKAVKREAYKNEVNKLYATTMPGVIGKFDGAKAEAKPEDKAANDAKKAEKAAKREAYKNEVNKLYATTMPGVIGKFGGGR